jgi:AbrB family looped-hinge helix DNA binding protein
MRSATSTITAKGQITIPADIRRHLGVDVNDRITFVVDGDDVRLQPARFSVATAYGSVEPITRPEDFEERIDQAKEERAQRAAAKLRGA